MLLPTRMNGECYLAQDTSDCVLISRSYGSVATQRQLRHMVDVIYFNLYRGRFILDSLLGPSNGCLAKSLLKVGLMPIVAGCRLVVLEQDWAQPVLDVDLMSMNVVCGIACA